MSRTDPPEIALCAAWHAGDFPQRLNTVAGEAIEVVHRGAWTHGLGPDFRDAILLFSGTELRAGGIEIHLRTRGWTEHGHHRDPAYETVQLHLVLNHDGSETRRADGALVPVAVLDWPDDPLLPDLATWDWDRVGGASCAEELAATNPRPIREALSRLGDLRLATRSARLEAQFSVTPPGEVLWRELLDGFGYSANREPMRSLAANLPLNDLERILLAIPASNRLAAARSLLLGAAGFLPLAPADAHLGRLPPEDVATLEAAWSAFGAPWRETTLAPSAWQQVRVRPANHPAARLLAAANLVARAVDHGGLLALVLDLLLTSDDPAGAIRALTVAGVLPGIGIDRALDIFASAIIPFALALSAHSGAHHLGAAASRCWEDLPAPAPNAVTRRAATQVAGRTRLARIGARGTQGLLHLDTALCQPRRCFECPIAAAALHATPQNVQNTAK